MDFGPWAAVSGPLAAYKAHSVRAAARIVSGCRRRCGFSGLLDVNRLAGYQGFLDAFDTAGGDSQLMLYDLGRARVLNADEHPPGAALPPLDGPGWWPAVARAHERRLAAALRAEQPEEDGFEQWNPLLERAGELGEAYAARLAAEAVAHCLAAVRDPRLREVLGLLATLHGLSGARRWAGRLLAAGTLCPDDLRPLPDTADRLGDALTPHLPLLERAFGYPAELVRSPLGAPDYTLALARSLTWNHGGST
ncbi:hypothetical protein GXW82_04205 [Streptacidiphilus sp. 4-A2]|nr:hypothetical protein [Streptacidiphilus sp. 4-A2]